MENIHWVATNFQRINNYPRLIGHKVNQTRSESVFRDQLVTLPNCTVESDSGYLNMFTNCLILKFATALRGSASGRMAFCVE